MIGQIAIVLFFACCPFLLAGFLLVVVSFAEGKLPVKSIIFFVLAALIISLPGKFAIAQEGVSFIPSYPTGSLFAEQCESAHYAKLINLISKDETWLDLNVLMTMQYQPGVWQGYESPTPWGGSFPDVTDGWFIELYTPCGVFPGNAWKNLDGSILIILITEMRLTDFYAQPCELGDGSERCGYHQNTFGYVTAEEWQRVSSATYR